MKIKCGNTIYLIRERFTDFSRINWNSEEWNWLDKNRTVLFFDDHIHETERLLEAHKVFIFSSHWEKLCWLCWSLVHGKVRF